uniref:C2 domain-containing protein n=1 Tax=Macrostomum lignano TaxID=282301 RepID=A0A1I8JQA0_9PLAT
SFTFAPRHGGNRGRRQLQIEVIDSDDSKLANSSLGGRLLAGTNCKPYKKQLAFQTTLNLIECDLNNEPAWYSLTSQCESDAPTPTFSNDFVDSYRYEQRSRAMIGFDPTGRTLSPTSDFGGVNSRKRQLPILPQQHLVGGGVSRGGYGGAARTRWTARPVGRVRMRHRPAASSKTMSSRRTSRSRGNPYAYQQHPQYQQQQHRRRPGAGPTSKRARSDVSENSDAASELSKLSVVSTQSERPRMMRGGAAAAHAAAASATASRSSAMSAAAGATGRKISAHGDAAAASSASASGRSRRSSSGHRFSTLFPSLGRKSNSTNNLQGALGELGVLDSELENERRHKTSIRSEEVLPMHMVAAGGPAGECRQLRRRRSRPMASGVSRSGRSLAVARGRAASPAWTAEVQTRQSAPVNRQVNRHPVNPPIRTQMNPPIRTHQLNPPIAHPGCPDGIRGRPGPGQLVGQAGAGRALPWRDPAEFVQQERHLEVEVIRARVFTPRRAPSSCRALNVKVYLLEGRNCVEKQKTTVTRRTLDPLYQQQLIFLEEFRGKILQVTVWGDCGPHRSQAFMGVCQILLDDLDLSNIVIGWYKLYPTSSLAPQPPERRSCQTHFVCRHACPVRRLPARAPR